ncbi:O-antigen ligase domain-containing protein [Lyngbya aestuarii]|uniref:O-antigen ligase domain-containing protein n=1 Tax=Lyngbya aestuarii TaxID=118322 RepID=UPI00403D63B2
MGFKFLSNPFSPPSLLVPLVMFAWIPVVLYIFMRFPAQRAIVISFIGAWLFLPEAGLELPALPDYDKASATSYGVLLATFIFDFGRFSLFRFGWIDIPMLIWCLCPIASSMTNGLGLYDGVTTAVTQTMSWGVPYFLGRIYLNDLAGLRKLAVGIFVGGLVYVPLCLYEIRLSPQLHNILYGGHPSGFGMSIRLGGFRPTVFMRHGLAVGMWMMTATLIGIWLWRTGVVKQIWNIPVTWLVAALLVTFVLCKSTGAYIYLGLGLVILFIGKYFRTAIPAFLVVLSICSYLYINAETETYFTDQIITSLKGAGMPEERVQSLEFRFNNEELLTDKARERKMFGWGGWGRALIFDEDGKQLTIQDSLWIIAFGHHGTVGIASLTASMLLPVVSLFWFRYPASLWSNRKVAPAAVLAMVLILFMIDCLLNAMVNPIYVVANGAIAGVILKEPESNRTKKRLPQSKSGYLGSTSHTV